VTGRCRRGGVTTVEVLVAASLVAVVLGGLYGLASFGGRSTATSMVHADCAARERLVLDQLTREMEHCRNIVYPTVGTVADYLLFQSHAGMHHLLRLAPGRRHLVLTVVERGDHYVVADTVDTPLTFARLLFTRPSAGSGVDMTLSFRKADDETAPMFSYAVTRLGVHPDGLR